LADTVLEVNNRTCDACSRDTSENHKSSCPKGRQRSSHRGETENLKEKLEDMEDGESQTGRQHTGGCMCLKNEKGSDIGWVF
jgi:hypothetical protein